MNPEISAKMKRLFNFTKSPATQASNSTATGSTPTSRPQSVLSVNLAHKTGLQPKYVVPPVPHPCPYEHVAILATSEGLLLRPHFPDEINASKSYVKVTWGKEGKIEEIEEAEDSKPLDWTDCSVVYGVLGVLNLFSGTAHSSYTLPEGYIDCQCRIIPPGYNIAPLCWLLCVLSV